jgi:hypothetical protein
VLLYGAYSPSMHVTGLKSGLLQIFLRPIRAGRVCSSLEWTVDAKQASCLIKFRYLMIHDY